MTGLKASRECGGAGRAGRSGAAGATRVLKSAAKATPASASPLSKRPLSPRRQEALAFIQSEVSAGRPFPLNEAIARRMGWRYATSATDVLHALRRSGYIRLAGREYRGRGWRHKWELLP